MTSTDCLHGDALSPTFYARAAPIAIDANGHSCLPCSSTRLAKLSQSTNDHLAKPRIGLRATPFERGLVEVIEFLRPKKGKKTPKIFEILHITTPRPPTVCLRRWKGGPRCPPRPNYAATTLHRRGRLFGRTECQPCFFLFFFFISTYLLQNPPPSQRTLLHCVYSHFFNDLD